MFTKTNKFFTLMTLAVLVVVGGLTARADDEGYGVGVVTGFVTDPSRPWDPLVAEWGTLANTGFTVQQLDAVSNTAKAVRTLVVEIWYPVDEDDADEAPRATWGDFRFGNVAAHNDAFNAFAGIYGPGNGALTFDLKRKSVIGLPVAEGGPFPLIIMLHGNGSTRDDASSVAETLVKHGYVVMAIDRTGNSVVTQPGLIPGGVHPDLPIDADGRYPRTYGLVFESPPFSIVRRITTDFKSAVEDVEALLQSVTSGTLVPDRLNALLAGKIRTNTVGIQGCSLGSAQAQFAQSVIPEIAAWASVCSNLAPDQTPLLGPLVPVSFQGGSPDLPCSPDDDVCLAAAAGLFDRVFSNEPYTVDKPALWLGGREDTITFGIEGTFAALGLVPPPNANGERFPAHRQLFDNARGPVVYTVLDRLDHLGYLIRPEMNELRKLGVVTGERTGIDGNAYELQQTKRIKKIRDFYVVNFFDAFLRDKTNKLPKLQKNRFTKDGLHLELANMP